MWWLGVPRVWEKIEERIREAGKATTGLKRTLADWAKAAGWILKGQSRDILMDFATKAQTGKGLKKIIEKFVNEKAS